MRNQAPQIQSVERALRLLDLLAEPGPAPGVTELGRRIGVHKATASRLLSTLAGHGLVEWDAATERYRLGFGLVRLASSVVGGLDLVQQARPVLQELAEQTEETVNLAVLDGAHVANIEQVAGSRAVVSVNWVGRQTPLHATSSGKVLLAALGPGDRARLLGGPLEALTPSTIVDPVILRRELAEVAERGYAATVEELEVGLNAVAAPVHAASGSVVAAVSVSGPSYRLSRQRIPELAIAVGSAAREISRRLGHREGRKPSGAS